MSKNYTGDICLDTVQLITNYYKDLIKNNKVVTSKQICDDLGISCFTINRYWNLAGLTLDSLGFEHENFTKLIIIHTIFGKRSPYYHERQRVLEEVNKKQRNKEVIYRLKEISELKKARTNLVNTLKEVSYKQKIR